MQKFLLTSTDKIITGILCVGILSSLNWPILFLAKYPQYLGSALIGTVAGIAITIAICLLLALLADVRAAVRSKDDPTP